MPPPLVVALISPFRSFRSSDPPEVESLSFPSQFFASMLPPLVDRSMSSFEFLTSLLPPLVLPSTVPPTLLRSRLPPLVENFNLPDKLFKLILPPLVDRSVETFLGTKTLKEIFSAFFQSVIFPLTLAVAVTLLLATEISRLYFSFSLCWISSFVSCLLLFEVI